MRIRWRQFELPTKVLLDHGAKTQKYGKFIAEPFERGFGTTIGNSLRRVLLSSIEGAAVTSVRIEGVQHEFSTIPGVYEDVTDILLNVKQILLKIDSPEPQRLTLSASRKGEVKAGMIQCPAGVEIVDPDVHVCTLTDDVKLSMELNARRGRGYITAVEHEAEAGEQHIGLIHIDSIFTPVRRVHFTIENTRIGQLTNYDRLVLEIWTDGTVSPEMALIEASKILRKHLNPFVQYYELGVEMPLEEMKEDEAKKMEKYMRELQSKLTQPISVLDLSVRASNCLESENIQIIRDLVQKTESDMLKIRNFGKTSLREVKKKLSEIGLTLGMTAEALGEEAKTNAAQG
jgi:DNA-directed RNA polymerase subunit alpha